GRARNRRAIWASARPDGGEQVMRGTVMYAAGDVRIENVPDPTIQEPTDAVIRVTRACICGSDLWPYKTLQPEDGARVMGHEAIGVVEEIGADVRTLKIGDVVVMPFAFSDGTCIFCDEGLQSECVHGRLLRQPRSARCAVGSSSHSAGRRDAVCPARRRR